MGGGSWSSATYLSYSSSKGLTSGGKLTDNGTLDFASMNATAKSAHEIFTASQVNQALDPKNVKVRESRDSAEHPNSNAIAFALDVTGSMNVVAKYIAQMALPKLMEEIYKRKPVADPQVMFMGVDDLEAGGHFQVSQFESDIRIAEQLQLIWLENNGGGNDFESYSLPWYFLAHHTAIDCFEKRGKKGYAISCGDEMPDPGLLTHQMEYILGYKPQAAHGKIDAKKILKDVEKQWNVIHVIAEEGSFARSNKSMVRGAWHDLLGPERVISLPDYTKLAEVVISAIQISEGQDPGDVAKTWDKATAKVVAAVTKDVKRIVEL